MTHNTKKLESSEVSFYIFDNMKIGTTRVLSIERELNSGLYDKLLVYEPLY